MSVERKKRKERCCARWQMLLRSMTMGRKHWAERPLLAQNLLHSSLSLPVSLVAVAIPSPLRARPRSGVPKPKIENHPHLHQPSMAEERMEEASTEAAAAATPFQLQFDKPVPFQVSSPLLTAKPNAVCASSWRCLTNRCNLYCLRYSALPLLSRQSRVVARSREGVDGSPRSVWVAATGV